MLPNNQCCRLHVNFSRFHGTFTVQCHWIHSTSILCLYNLQNLFFCKWQFWCGNPLTCDLAEMMKHACSIHFVHWSWRFICFLLIPGSIHLLPAACSWQEAEMTTHGFQMVAQVPLSPPCPQIFSPSPQSAMRLHMRLLSKATERSLWTMSSFFGSKREGVWLSTGALGTMAMQQRAGFASAVHKDSLVHSLAKQHVRSEQSKKLGSFCSPF